MTSLLFMTNLCLGLDPKVHRGRPHRGAGSNVDGGTKDLEDKGRAVGKQVLFVDVLYKQCLKTFF